MGRGSEDSDPKVSAGEEIIRASLQQRDEEYLPDVPDGVYTISIELRRPWTRWWHRLVWGWTYAKFQCGDCKHWFWRDRRKLKELPRGTWRSLTAICPNCNPYRGSLSTPVGGS